MMAYFYPKNQPFYHYFNAAMKIYSATTVKAKRTNSTVHSIKLYA
jgi:hypothetical protein